MLVIAPNPIPDTDMDLIPEKLKNRIIPPPQSPGEELDRELARGMLDGSRESLGHFVDRHLGPLARYLERRLGPGQQEAVEQIVRSTMLDAFQHLRPYAAGLARTPMRLWLIRRAERQIRRQTAEGRKQTTDGGRRTIPTPHSALRTPHSPERGSLDWLRQSLDGMPRRQKAALCLALFEKLTPAEMGQAMGVRPARAMRLLRGALLRVNKRILAQEGFEA